MTVRNAEYYRNLLQSHPNRREIYVNNPQQLELDVMRLMTLPAPVLASELRPEPTQAELDEVTNFDWTNPTPATPAQAAAQRAVVEHERACIEDRINTTADDILSSEDIFEYFLQQYRRLHIGDEIVCSALLLTAVCPHVKNSFGLFPKISGEKGTGKSSGVYATAKLIHPRYVLTTSFSGKALFYNDIQEGHIIISDDSRPNDDIIELMKKKMSSEYHTITKHLTVDINRKGATQSIPPGVTFIMTSVADSADDQLVDRQWVISVVKNAENDRNYAHFLLTSALTGFENFNDTFEMRVCHEITRRLKTRSFDVVIPYADYIHFSTEAMNNRRSENIFLDIIRCSAAIYHQQRETTPDRKIHANIDDFNFALSMMTGGEENWSLKLSEPEKKVWAIIKESGRNGISQKEIADIMKRSEGRIHQILFGEGKSTAGLSMKAPIVSERIADKIVDEGIDEKNDRGVRTVTKTIWRITDNVDATVSFASIDMQYYINRSTNNETSTTPH